MNANYIKRIIDDPTIRIIASRVLEGGRLSLDEAILLMKKAETGVLGMLVGEVMNLRGLVNEKRDKYHISLSENCTYKCPACRYSQQNKETAKAYEDVKREIVECDEVDEIILSSGIDPQLNLQYFSDILKVVNQYKPSGARIRGLRAIHIAYLAKQEAVETEQVIEELHSAGLNSICGGDALILRPEMRSKMQGYDFSMEQWLSIHEQAHRAGLKSDASITYGHFESVEDRMRHLQAIRELQDVTSGFDYFTPVKFRAETGLSRLIPATSGLEDMRVFAVSRLFLDNIDFLDVQTVVAEEGWEEAFAFGGNMISCFKTGSHQFLPQYGELFVAADKS